MKFGRKKTVDREKIKELREKGTGASEIAHQMKIGRSTVYNVSKRSLHIVFYNTPDFTLRNTGITAF